jgi:hypothetical protein
MYPLYCELLAYLEKENRQQCVDYASGNIGAGPLVISRVAEGHCFRLLLKL